MKSWISVYLSLNTDSYPFLGLCCPGQLSSASETGLSPQVYAILCVDIDSACNVFCCCLFLVLSLSLCPIMAQKTVLSFPTSWALRVARCPEHILWKDDIKDRKIWVWVSFLSSFSSVIWGKLLNCCEQLLPYLQSEDNNTPQGGSLRRLNEKAHV